MNAQPKSRSLLTGAVSRRDFLRLAATGAGGVIMAACAAPPAPVKTEAPTAAAAATEAPVATTAPAATKAPILVFECCWNEQHVEAGRALYADFQAQHPEMAIDVFWNPPGEDWTAKLLAQVAANDPIDIIWWCASHHLFAEEGRLLDLNELVNADSSFKLDAYQKVGVDFCYDKPARQGALWGLPTNYATVLLWYNKKMFDAAGVGYPNKDWTYDDLLQAAQALTKDTNNDGTPDEWGLKIGNDSWYYEPFVKGFGGGLTDVNGPTPCLITKPESIEALQWLQDLQYKHKVSPTSADMAGLGDQAMLISDKLAMGVWPEWGQDQFLAAHADSGLEYGVNMLPIGPKARVTNYWAGITSIMKQTQAPKAAWEVAKFICGEKYQTKMTVDLPESPAALIQVAEFRFKEHEKYPEDRSAFLDSPQYGAQYFVVDRYGKEMGDIVGPGLDPVWEGKKTPAEVVDDICAKVDAKLAEIKAG